MPASRGVRRTRSSRGVAFGNGQRDPLLRRLVDREAAGSAVQAQEALERFWRIGEYAEEVGCDAELRLHGASNGLAAPVAVFGSTA